jgi:hypothetical protein
MAEQDLIDLARMAASHNDAAVLIRLASHTLGLGSGTSR